MITTEGFIEVWNMHYQPRLASILGQHGNEQDRVSINKIKEHIIASRVFCDGHLDDEPQRLEQEWPFDPRALLELRNALMADAVRLQKICQKISNVGDQESIAQMRRLSLGIVAMMDITVASISHMIAAANNVPLPNLA